MPAKTKGLPYVEQLPEGTIPLSRGEVVALPDDPDNHDGSSPIEYGIIRGIGIADGTVCLDLEMYDSRVGYQPPAEGEDAALRRVAYPGGIQ